MARAPKVTPEQVEQMRKLRDGPRRLTYQQIANIVGVHKTAAYYWLNSRHQRLKKAYNVERNREGNPHIKVYKQPSVMPWQEEPEDTRSLSARIMGDPIPGRSALDMKIKEQQDALNSQGSGDPFRAPPAYEDGKGRPR